MTAISYKKIKAALIAQRQMIADSPKAATQLIDDLGIRSIVVKKTTTKSSSAKKASSRKAVAKKASSV